MAEVKDLVQFRIVKDKADVELRKLLSHIPSSMPKLQRDKILYDLITQIHNHIKIPK